MALFDVAQLTMDNDFTQRVSACYAIETGEGNPNPWVADHMWSVASAPGFGDAYASAIAGGIVNPGRDQSVISDAQILSAVQPLIEPA